MIEKINGYRNYHKKKFRNSLMDMNLRSSKNPILKSKFQSIKNQHKPANINFLILILTLTLTIIEILILKCLLIQIVILLMIHQERNLNNN
jgi:hypothetical protein